MISGATPTLAAQRCHYHPVREAVARCPECKRFFCRECITEHDDRVICASCLQKLAGEKKVARKRFGGAKRFFAGAAGIIVAWIFFYSMGRLLLLVPTTFHEGTMWHLDAGDDAP